MVTVKEKTTITQRVHGACPTHSRTEISVRDVRSVIDEPKEREGTNMGPTPTGNDGGCTHSLHQRHQS